jgi:hypothetical protein
MERNPGMDKQRIVDVLASLDAIHVLSIDTAECDSAKWAATRIRNAGETDMADVLRDLSRHLFSFKGPFYESFDNSEELDEMRSTCRRTIEIALDAAGPRNLIQNNSR